MQLRAAAARPTSLRLICLGAMIRRKPTRIEIRGEDKEEVRQCVLTDGLRPLSTHACPLQFDRIREQQQEAAAAAATGGIGRTTGDSQQAS